MSSKLTKINDFYPKFCQKKISSNFLDGEHSLTIGSIKPFVKKYNELILLHFDAHADLRDKYNGEKYSHASAIKRCLDFKNVKVVSFGIRNLSQYEMNFFR